MSRRSWCRWSEWYFPRRSGSRSWCQECRSAPRWYTQSPGASRQGDRSNKASLLGESRASKVSRKHSLQGMDEHTFPRARAHLGAAVWATRIGSGAPRPGTFQQNVGKADSSQSRAAHHEKCSVARGGIVSSSRVTKAATGGVRRAADVPSKTECRLQWTPWRGPRVGRLRPDHGTRYLSRWACCVISCSLNEF